MLYTLDLSASDDRTIEITTAEGRNIVEIQDHRIRVKDADCPDQTCVRMGWLTGSAAPIVCLPHHLVIEFTDDTGGADAVTR